MSKPRVKDSKALIYVPDGKGGATTVEAPAPKVLEEIEYETALTAIVERDYFPDLPRLKAHYEWNDAVKRGDLDKMLSIRQQFAVRSRQQAFPFDTSNSTPDIKLNITQTPNFYESAMEPPRKKIKLDEEASSQSELPTDLTLDQFTLNYTGEDNASISKLLSKEAVVSDRAYAESKFAQSSKLHDKLIAQGSSGQFLVSWKEYDPLNSVIFYPKGLPETLTDADLKRGEKVLIPANTRFAAGPIWKRNAKHVVDQEGFAVPEIPIHHRQQNVELQDDTDAQLYRQIVEANKSNPDMPHVLDSNPDFPTVKGYSFLPPIPSGFSSVEVTPDVASGTGSSASSLSLGLDKLPQHIRDTSTNIGNTSSGFSIPQKSKRDQIASDLAKASTRKRSSKKPSSNSTAASPRIFSGKTPITATSTPDLQLRSSYTPTIKHHGSSTPQATPKSTPRLLS